MEKYAINKKMLRQLSLMNNHKEPSIEILDSLLSQMFLEVSIYQFQKEKLQTNIDVALSLGDKQQFTKYAEEYNEMLVKYKDGINFYEQGFEYTMDLEEHDL